jgi:hypothetical protein
VVITKDAPSSTVKTALATHTPCQRRYHVQRRISVGYYTNLVLGEGAAEAVDVDEFVRG